ncbi:MAG: alpha/beta hydrolase-fold protein, partial [Bacteroidota bacterium]
RLEVFENGTVLEISIAGWEDFPGVHSLEPTMRVLDTDVYLPYLESTRRIWVQLPEGYHDSTMDYPVLYLQDGQNVFNSATSFVGEWEVDETMNALDPECPQSIVVGVDNGGAERINEYSPWVHPDYGGGNGHLYAQDLVEVIKPLIDSTLRTLPQREFTGVGGSSLGGLISLYLLLEHQDVFSKGLIASPSLWFSEGIYETAQNTMPLSDTKFYFFGGTSESSTMVSNMEAMLEVLTDQGFNQEQMTLVTHDDGAHSEWYWAREYEDAYKWLHNDIPSSLTTQNLAPSIGPIPTFGSIRIQLWDEEIVQVTVWGLDQQLLGVLHSRPGQKNFDLSNIPNGVCILQIQTKRHNYYQRIIKE